MLHRLMSYVLFISLASTSWANDVESIDKLNQLAKNFISQQIVLGKDETVDIHIADLKQPLTLSKCHGEVTPSFPDNVNKDQINAIKLTCQDNYSWHVLIPVEVHVYTNVLVTKRIIPRGDVIEAEDLDYAKYDKSQLYSGYFTDKESIVGQQANQLLASGTVVTKHNLQKMLLIHRNQTIDLIAKNSAIMVMMHGIAKSDGGLNDTIKAFNPSSKRMLDAVVVGPGRAEVI